MKRLVKFILVVFYFVASLNAQAQNDDAILRKQWKAAWIKVPETSDNGYGVYLFRKSIDITAVPSSFIIHVSADNRYKLFVNGKLVSLGPARGDINHWNYETVDIAPYMRTGKNIIASQVWNEGEWRAEAQISLRTGFILQGATDAENIVNTNNSWKCIKDSSYQPIKVTLQTYYVTGPGELVDMSTHINNWESLDYNDNAWSNAQTIFPGSPKTIMGAYGTPSGWLLVPSAIPQMELKVQRLSHIKKTDGVIIPATFPTSKTAITIPSNTSATILLDQDFLTNAYLSLVLSGGKDAGISLAYAEALFTKYPQKGNRNETDGKFFMGRKDSIISNGTNGQIFTSLTFRTYRYILLKITTKDAALTIDDLYGTFTGYPFKYNAALLSEDTELNKILETGWRTARLCAVETYTDCPYYEQLQYIGDARIQALVSLYNSGDDRLIRNALNLMDESRLPEGVTLSRHPSATPQYIPTFSLWYIGMLHDYLMYGKDTGFIKNKLAGERQVLNYFRNYQQPDGSLKNVPYWMFTDWVKKTGWTDGEGPVGKDGSAALLDLQLLWAYQLAADMEAKIGIKDYAALYTEYAVQLKKMIRNKYWDDTKKLIADRPEKDLFSQHANALAILTDVVDKTSFATIEKKLINDTTLAPASIYFKYYLHQAFIKAGFGNDYLSWLDIWRENFKMGLTTWAEISDINAARSDCHAWGASPNIEFFRTILGIDSDAIGFTKVKIEPHLGTLKNISGFIPHPYGKIAVEYLYKNNKWMIAINLPQKITGSFIWKGKTYPLHEGSNNFQI